MTAVPLYCFIEGDSLGVLVMVDDHESVAELAQQAQQAAAVRVVPRAHVVVYAHGAVLDRDATVKEVGLIALDRIDVVEGS
jgi:hypothetical protein